MQAQFARAAEVYRQTQIQSRSPLELVVMLYDGADTALRSAREAIERGDREAKRQAISRGLAILSELQSTLNVREGGEIALELDRLYSFAIARLIEGNAANAAAPVDEVLRVLGPLREAWTTLASSGAPQAPR